MSLQLAFELVIVFIIIVDLVIIAVDLVCSTYLYIFRGRLKGFEGTQGSHHDTVGVMLILDNFLLLLAMLD